MIPNFSKRDTTTTDLPWIEDVISMYYTNSIKNIFATFDFNTLFITIFHLIGIIAVYYGVFLPPKYIWVHTTYVGILLGSYILFKNNCFMTVVSKFQTVPEKPFIYFKIETAISAMIAVFFISFFSNFFPSISPFNIIKTIILKMDN
jgi:hypothetical protein